MLHLSTVPAEPKIRFLILNGITFLYYHKESSFDTYYFKSIGLIAQKRNRFPRFPFMINGIYRFQPFTAPAIIPLTSLSWKMTNRMIIGKTDRVSTARMIGISRACSPLN